MAIRHIPEAQPRLVPPDLQPGDTIGVVSPSWFAGEPFFPRLQHGLDQMERLGFRPRVAPHARNANGWVSDTAENRAADLHEMFRDPDVAAIVATIGGDHSCHLLPLLDWGLIRANPKILMGFSDTTVLNVAIWRMTGLGTFNGPTVLTEWAEYPEMPAYTREHLLPLLTRPEPLGELRQNAEWTEEFLEWEDPEKRTRPRKHRPSAGWTWLHPGFAEGPLVGGCLESLQHLRGTPYWPDLEGAILFIETSEECASPAEVDGILMDYENMGVLDQIAGLLVARPYGFEDEDHAVLRDVVRERCARFGFPIVCDMEFGHTSPMLTLPLGCRARIDTATQSVAIVEAAVR